MQEKILIIDFGSQYTQLIARKVRELSVYCEIHPYNNIPELDKSVKGIILSGSPFSVRDQNAPQIDLKAFMKKKPLLGVCYGAQYLAHSLGGEVVPSEHREYGRANLHLVETKNLLFQNISENSQVWMSHGDTITKLPKNFEKISSTKDIEVGAFQINDEKTYGLQFHPEVYHTKDGKKNIREFFIKNFKIKARLDTRFIY